MRQRRTRNPVSLTLGTVSFVILMVLTHSAPASGQVIVVNQQIVSPKSVYGPGRITVHDRAANGDIQPDQVIEGPETGLIWPFAGVVDLEQQELFVLIGLGYVINVYGLFDEGDTSPKRTISHASAFVNPFSMALDPVNHEIFVFDDGTSVLVFDSRASGAVEPLRVLNTNLYDTGFIAVDPAHDELYVQQESLIRVYARTAAGDDSPIREISGGKTGMDGRYSLAVDNQMDEIFVAGNQSIRVFPRTGDGNIEPIRVIEGANTGLTFDHRIAYDPSWRTLFLTSHSHDKVLSFARDAEGNVPPLRTIVGDTTGLGTPRDIVALGLVFVDDFEEGDITGWDQSVCAVMPPFRTFP